jgi:hypothetical protein
MMMKKLHEQRAGISGAQKNMLGDQLEALTQMHTRCNTHIRACQAAVMFEPDLRDAVPFGYAMNGDATFSGGTTDDSNIEAVAARAALQS